MQHTRKKLPLYPLPVFNELDASAVHLCSEISDNFVNLGGLGSLDIALSGLSLAHCDYLLIFLFLSKYEHKYKMISQWQTQGMSQVTLRSRLEHKTFSPSNGAVWINRARIVESRSFIEPRDTSRVRQVGTLSQTIPTAGPRGSDNANNIKDRKSSCSVDQQLCCHECCPHQKRLHDGNHS